MRYFVVVLEWIVVCLLLGILFRLTAHADTTDWVALSPEVWVRLEIDHDPVFAVTQEGQALTHAGEDIFTPPDGAWSYHPALHMIYVNLLGDAPPTTLDVWHAAVSTTSTTATSTTVTFTSSSTTFPSSCTATNTPCRRGKTCCSKICWASTHRCQ